MRIERVGDVKLQWGESLRWDDRRQRLYFVDCGTQKLHWFEGVEPPLQGVQLPSFPTGVVLANDGRLVVALDDGLHVVDPDTGETELLAPYPDGLGGRANDATADLDGNLVTGTLNLMPGSGSYWWYSAVEGWRRLDDGISNANGPAVFELEGRSTLVAADTHAAVLHAYDYDGPRGRATSKRTFATPLAENGFPDGSCVDADGGVWSCLLAAGLIARYTPEGLDRSIETGVEMPSDVTFGGSDLATMFFVSIAVDVGGFEISSENAGRVMAVTDLGFTGRAEPRFEL